MKMEIEKTDEEIIEAAKLKAAELRKEELKEQFKIVYDKIVSILKKYCDLREDYYCVVALWIIGTWFHKNFSTYPYLFFNAMKGSGKTRLLNLIAHLSWNGKVLVNVSEAVLFRTASQRTLCIDEFESVGTKEKQALRELLNVAYKNGGVVERAYKVKKDYKELMEIESFDVYCPVAMANIWGMDNVLADRCITIILEKSTNKAITRLLENFELDDEITELKQKLFGLVTLVTDTTPKIISKETYEQWNRYIVSYSVIHTQESKVSQESEFEKNEVFDKIIRTSLQGRDLELFFPLFIIASNISDEVFDNILRIAENIVKTKREEDMAESRDMALLNFIATELEETGDFIPVKTIASLFRESEEEEWITPDWVGRALKRLGLVIEKRRKAKSREVRIDFKSAKNKINAFLNKSSIIITQEVEKTIKTKTITELKTEQPALVKTCPLCGLEVDLINWNEELGCCNYCANLGPSTEMPLKRTETALECEKIQD